MITPREKALVASRQKWRLMSQQATTPTKKFISKQQFVAWFEEARNDFGESFTMEDWAKMNTEQGYEVEGLKDFYKARIEFANKKQEAAQKYQAQDNSILPKWLQKILEPVAWAIAEAPSFAAETAGFLLKNNPQIPWFIWEMQGNLVAGYGNKIDDKITQWAEWIWMDSESMWYKWWRLATQIVWSVVGWPKPTAAANTALWFAQRAGIGALEGARGEIGADGSLDSEDMGTVGVSAAVEALLPFAWKALVKLFKKAPKGTLEEVGARIVQEWDARTLKQSVEALKEFDFTKAKNVTFDSLQSDVKARITLLDSFKKNTLKAVWTTFDASQTTTVVGKGKNAVSVNYVRQSLDLLDEHLAEVWEYDKLAIVRDYADKFADEGLSAQEIDELAQLFPSNIKSFGANWNALSSKMAVSGENIRTGLKKTSRELAGKAGKEAQEYDKSLSNLLTLDKQLTKLAEKKVELQAKFKARPLGKKVWIVIWRILDAVSFKSLWWLLEWAMTSNIGNKTANIVDVESMLTKNLRLFEALQAAPDDIATWTFDRFAKYIKQATDLDVE